ncbi:hypothetical protein HDV00_000368 [Rhizophlyctis rosea]|nr:hypothetical protein HDV00_000368 [Rhizophlyctis rosea]
MSPTATALGKKTNPDRHAKSAAKERLKRTTYTSSAKRKQIRSGKPHGITKARKVPIVTKLSIEDLLVPDFIGPPCGFSDNIQSDFSNEVFDLFTNIASKEDNRVLNGSCRRRTLSQCCS